MGARPMARVIQEHIKKPLADEVLFGKLKSGGHVRVIVITDEAGNSKLGFEYPEGPVMPRPEKLPEPRRAKKRRVVAAAQAAGPRRQPAAAPRLGAEGAAGQGLRPRTVPSYARSDEPFRRTSERARRGG